MLNKLPKELIIRIAEFVPYICLENDPKIAMLMYHCEPIPKIHNDNKLTVSFDNIIEIAPNISIDWLEEAYNNFVKESSNLNNDLAKALNISDTNILNWPLERFLCIIHAVCRIQLPQYRSGEEIIETFVPIFTNSISKPISDDDHYKSCYIEYDDNYDGFPSAMIKLATGDISTVFLDIYEIK